MLEKMPLTLNTKGRVGYRNEMEKKLANIEDAIVKFSGDKEIYIDIAGN
jgi:hypothetical protein